MPEKNQSVNDELFRDSDHSTLAKEKEEILSNQNDDDDFEKKFAGFTVEQGFGLFKSIRRPKNEFFSQASKAQIKVTPSMNQNPYESAFSNKRDLNKATKDYLAQSEVI